MTLAHASGYECSVVALFIHARRFADPFRVVPIAEHVLIIAVNGMFAELLAAVPVTQVRRTHENYHALRPGTLTARTTQVHSYSGRELGQWQCEQRIYLRRRHVPSRALTWSPTAGSLFQPRPRLSPCCHDVLMNQEQQSADGDDYDLDLEEPYIDEEAPVPHSPEEFREGAGEIDPDEPPQVVSGVASYFESF